MNFHDQERNLNTTNFSSSTQSLKKMSRHPSTKWAQRSDRVFMTVELPDAKDVNLKLEPDGHFSFSAKSGADNVSYELDFDLFDKVNVDESKAAIGSRHIVYLISKEEKKWWPRLLKQSGRPPVFLKVDWDKWIDEDDDNNKFGDTDFGGMDFSELGMDGSGEFDDDEDGDLAESAHEEPREEATQTKEAKLDEENNVLGGR